MTAVRLRGNDYRTRAIEVHRRNIGGETLTELAEEYACSHEAMRLWVKHGRRYDAPDMDDRDGQRAEANSILWGEIWEATEKGDGKEVVVLLDRLSKFNGLDHSHRVQEAKLQLDAARIQLMSTTMTKALEGAEVPVSQRRKVLELMMTYANGD